MNPAMAGVPRYMAPARVCVPPSEGGGGYTSPGRAVVPGYTAPVRADEPPSQGVTLST